jgi:hypothetical protein
MNVKSTAFNLMTAFFAGQHQFDIHINMNSVRLQRSNRQQALCEREQSSDKSLARALQRTLRIICLRWPTGPTFYKSNGFLFRFPATKKVKLVSYQWQRSSDAYLSRFDFSQLEKLSLHDVNFYNFFLAVPIEHLENLKSLKIHTSAGHVQKNKGFSHSFIRERIAPLFDDLFPQLTRLTKLDIELYDWPRYIDPHNLSRTNALQTLRLMSDMSPYETEPMTLMELRGIGLGCPGLRFLEMNWPAEDVSADPYCSFSIDPRVQESLIVDFHLFISR